MTDETTLPQSSSPSPKTTRPPRSISLRELLIALVCLFLGGAVSIVVINAGSLSPESFTASGLISFTFGIALSAASIVLAIAAISLGKASEKIMVDRSDASIRLQSDIFVKTIDTLTRIESSTGVTEKRIEDIVSGRVGAISDRIVDRLLEDRLVVPKTRESLQSEVRESLERELASTEGNIPESDRKARRERRQARDRYNAFRNSILLGIANQTGTVVERIDSGSFQGKGDELADGIFLIDGRRIAVVTLSIQLHAGVALAPSFDQYLIAIAGEIEAGHFSDVLLVFDGELNPESPFAAALSRFRSVARTEISSHIHNVGGGPDLDPAAVLAAIREGPAA